MVIKANTDEIKQMRQKINGYTEKAETLRLMIEANTHEMQELCPHPRECLREGEHLPEGIIFFASPPFTVCTCCGYAEEGWCGYGKLNNYYSEVPRLSRDNAQKLVLGRIATREELGKLKYPKKKGE